MAERLDRCKESSEDSLGEAVDLLKGAVCRPNTLTIHHEHQLFEKVWAIVSRALDVGSYVGVARDELCAIEAELSGKVLTARMHRRKFPSHGDAVMPKGVSTGLVAVGLAGVFLGVNIGFVIVGSVSPMNTAFSIAASLVLMASGIWTSKRAYA